MIPEEYKNWKAKAKKRKKDEGLIKDRECATCEKWLECPGKERGINCLNYKEREKDNGMR